MTDPPPKRRYLTEDEPPPEGAFYCEGGPLDASTRRFIDGQTRFYVSARWAMRATDQTRSVVLDTLARELKDSLSRPAGDDPEWVVIARYDLAVASHPGERGAARDWRKPRWRCTLLLPKTPPKAPSIEDDDEDDGQGDLPFLQGL